MSWDDYYRRRALLDTILRAARDDPNGALPLATTPEAVELFGDEPRLLLALHYRWSQLLGGSLRAEIGAAVEDDPEGMHVDAVGRAWRAATNRHPTLRAVLDAGLDRYPAELLPAHQAEQRMLALTAGLAAPGEPAAEVTRIGAAFVALLRSRPAPRRNPVGRLLQRLTPSM